MIPTPAPPSNFTAASAGCNRGQWAFTMG
jgi:hypothetical protein